MLSRNVGKYLPLLAAQQAKERSSVLMETPAGVCCWTDREVYFDCAVSSTANRTPGWPAGRPAGRLAVFKANQLLVMPI
jgi:hypothetical protein